MLHITPAPKGYTKRVGGVLMRYDFENILPDLQEGN